MYLRRLRIAFQDLYEQSTLSPTTETPETTARMGENVGDPLTGPRSLLSNDDIENKLRFIEKLHTLGVSRYVDLPQLVVVGDQSCGKSSVLQAITRLPFPVSDTLCTRFATEVTLVRDPRPESLKVTIKKPSGESEDFPYPDAEGTAFGTPEFAALFSEILQEASEEIIGNLSDGQILSRDVLQLKVSGPMQNNLVIVDIPGLVSASHRAHADALALVKHYIDNPRSIISAVVNTSDPDTQEVFQMLQTIPNKETRVIGVITKCDRKQEGAEDWIFNTIKNVRTGNAHYLNQGWFGLRNRAPAEADLTDDERDMKEAAFFGTGDWTSLDRPANLGIKHLRTALLKMHNNHIARSIPQLIPEIQNQLEACKDNLRRLGEPRTTKAEQLSCMVGLAAEFSKLSASAIEGDYHNLPSDEEEMRLRKLVRDRLEIFRGKVNADVADFVPPITAEILSSRHEQHWRNSIVEHGNLNVIRLAIEANRGTELPDDINPNVLKAYSLTEAISKDIGSFLTTALETIEVEDELCTSTTAWLKEHIRPSSEAAEGELKKLIDDEMRMSTLSLNFASNVDRKYKNNLIKMRESLAIARGFPSPQNLPQDTQDSLDDQIRHWLDNNKDIAMILKTHARLVVYASISSNLFIENVARQVVERHLLGPDSPLRMFTPQYMVKMAEEDPEKLKRIAGENQDKVDERNDLNEEKAKLESALVEARNYGVFF